METKIVKTWETPSGITVEVKGEIILEKTVDLDGQSDTVPTCDLKVNVYANGKSQGSWVRKLSESQKKSANLPKQYTHYVGSLPLTASHVEIIRSVTAELEQHPARVAKQEKIAKNEAENAEYEASLNGVVGGHRDKNTY